MHSYFTIQRRLHNLLWLADNPRAKEMLADPTLGVLCWNPAPR
jgi:hypothetical protein